jgi:hypothetical protein
MKIIYPLLLTGCLSASTGKGSLTVRSTQPDRTFGQHGEVMVSNVPRVVATHCENLKECYDDVRSMCGSSGFVLIQERWLISKGHEREKGITSYDFYGLYFVLAECK